MDIYRHDAQGVGPSGRCNVYRHGYGYAFSRESVRLWREAGTGGGLDMSNPAAGGLGAENGAARDPLSR